MLTFFFDINELPPKQEQRMCNNGNKIIYYTANISKQNENTQNERKKQNFSKVF
jgi:hypothetical protein